MKTSNITNDVVTDYIYSLYTPQSEKLNKLRLKAEEDNVPIILRDVEELINNIIRIKKPLNILEVGTAVGYSSICFATASDKAAVTTIELDESTAQVARNNIADFGLEDRIQVLVGKGQEVLEEMAASGDYHFDMVFIDAAKSHYKTFWDHSVKMCNPEAVIISDNVLLKGGSASNEYDPTGRFKTNIRKMREYLTYITGMEDVNTSVLPVGDGLAISILRGNNEKD